jgi:3-oxoacyl-[acyl-carrier-protein] synthase II
VTAGASGRGTAAAVLGIGWIDAESYGCVRLDLEVAAAGEEGRAALWRDARVFPTAVRNWGRFDAASRLTCAACGLALRDAGLAEPGARRDLGLVGTSADGCLASNRAYFADYVECGRTLGRGNLFIYTLPSSALAETAIYFGLQGPLLYLRFAANAAARLLHEAAARVRRGEAAGMIATLRDGQTARAFVVGHPADDRPCLCSVDEAAALLEQSAGDALEEALAAGGKQPERRKAT